MSVQSMNGVLDQIAFQARQINHTHAAFSGGKAADGAGVPSFSSVLTDSLRSINQMQNNSRSLAENYLTGASGIGLNDVMTSMQKSSIALNLGVQVRNKLVSAYQEIMNLAV